MAVGPFKEAKHNPSIEKGIVNNGNIIVPPQPQRKDIF